MPSFGSLAIVLLTLLQLQYENKDLSPFETHGQIMMLFTVTIFIYTLIAIAAIKLETLANHLSLLSVLKHLSIGLGFLACNLLLLVIAIHFAYFFFGIWILLLFLVLFNYMFIPVFDKLRDCAYQLYGKVQNCLKKWSDRLHHAAPQASATSSTA